MDKPIKNLRTCSNGHQYYKTSDCPVCPFCEREVKPSGDLPTLAAPARRALENAGIGSLAQLSTYSEVAILKFHGMGPGSIVKLRAALKAAGLSFTQK